MSWLQRENSTVDIGTARFVFHLARRDTYQVWLRCWLRDKCGNSVGMRIDGREIGEFNDRRDRLATWHWKRAASHVRLRAGAHSFELTAYEDGVFVDKFALLPSRERFDRKAPPALNPLYAPARNGSLSITAEMQHQLRGTTQTVTVWVRRSKSSVRAGRVSFAVPAPFEVQPTDSADIEFVDGSPLAQATFRVHLPADAVVGEVEAAARFVSAGNVLGECRMAIGAHFDWQTSGPLDPASARAQRLMRQTHVTPQELETDWTRYPAKGYDRYRRFAFEQAYGQTQDKVVFLVADVDVLNDGTYLSLLTLDDYGSAYIGGKRVAGRPPAQSPAEGNLMMDRCRIAKGRQQLFIWVRQAAFADPTGRDRGRHSLNNWVCKWLVRRARHTIAPEIRGLPAASSPEGLRD